MQNFEINTVNLSQLPIEESLFALGNGYLGIRSNFEEGYAGKAEEIRGCYINGLYARVPITYPEAAYGFPEVSDKQPRLMDSQTITITLDEYPLVFSPEDYRDFTRVLDFEKGTTIRSFTYVLPNGKNAQITFKRMVSFAIKELFTIDVDINYSGEISVTSLLIGNVENYVNNNDPRVGAGHSKLIFTKTTDEPDYLEAEILGSKMQTGCRIAHSIQEGVLVKNEVIGETLSTTIQGKNHVSFTKFAVYVDSLRHSTSLQQTSQEIMQECLALGLENLQKKQSKHLQSFWKKSLITYGDAELESAIHFCIFQLYQSVGKDIYANISSKGLSGEGYEGHYFWETETYVIPVYLLTNPEIVKNLIQFRYNQMDLAKIEASNLGAHRGVKFPWRTISGIECSSYFPAGQAQYHINADIAYSIINYVLYTQDTALLADCGMEMLLQICLFFLEVGSFSEKGFSINGVTGPDEYTAIVDNDYYTNSLVKYTFKNTLFLFDMLDTKKQEFILQKAEFSAEDFAAVKKASDQMVLLYTDDGIAIQNDSFMDLPTWEEKDSKRPLLLHYHPLKIYNHRVLKQPDVVLAHFLNEDETTIDTIKKSYEYYEPLTTHDSSLSVCIHSIMACKIKDSEKALEFFYGTANLDIDNLQKNTKDGLHMANLAGTIMSIVYGFGGLRVKGTGVSLEPYKPMNFPDYSFRFMQGESLIKVEISENIRVTLLEGSATSIRIYGENIIVKDTVVIPLK